MEAYVSVLNYAIPFFLILIFFEAWIGHVKGEMVMRSMDTLASLISGVTNVFKDVLGLTVIIVSYDWMVGNLRLDTDSRDMGNLFGCFYRIGFFRLLGPPNIP